MGVSESTQKGVGPSQEQNTRTGLTQEVNSLLEDGSVPKKRCSTILEENLVSSEDGDRPPGGPDDRVDQVEDDPQSTYEDQRSQLLSHSSNELQPVVFNWRHGGKSVYLVTSQDDWQAEHKLRKSFEEFTAILNLPPGIHWYKFIVDDTWSCARDQPHKQEENGGFVNYVKVANCSAASLQDEMADPFNSKPGLFGSVYTRNPKTGKEEPLWGQKMPTMPMGPPPDAPPHLGQILLNEKPPTADMWQGPLLTRKPSHVEVEHLYLAQHVHDEITTMGLTTRYGEKTYTTVYYRPRSHPPRRHREAQERPGS